MDITGLHFADLLFPLLSIGVLFTVLIMFIPSYIRFPRQLYLAVLVSAALGIFYMAFEITVKALTALQVDFVTIVQYDRLQKLIVAFFLPAIPFYLRDLLGLKGIIEKINRAALFIALGVALFVILSAFLRPDIYISIDTPHSEVHFDYSYIGRGEPGILYKAVEVLFGQYMGYSLVLVIFDLRRKKQFKKSYPFFLGSILSIYFIFSALIRSAAGVYIDPFWQFNFPRVVTGITILNLFYFFGVHRLFLSRAQEVSMTKDKLQRREHQLYTLAFTDTLTGQANRAAFFRDLKMLLSEDLSRKKHALFVVDMNDFQDLNESYGASVGDGLIKAFARRLLESIPAECRLYRFGGDEFIISFPDAESVEQIRGFGELIKKSVEEGLHLAGERYYIESTIGIIVIPDHGSEVSSVSKTLYTVMKKAQNRKNVIEIYTPEMIEESQKRIAVVRSLRESLKRDDFYMVYQPILNSSRKVVGAEALIRWKHGNGISSPEYFIPVAESAGLMPELGNLVIGKVAQEMGPYVGVETFPRVHINLSPSQFHQDDLVKRILAHMKIEGIPPEKLGLEVTESLLMEDIGRCTRMLQVLKDEGMSIAIDDFGTGYSSMSYLQSLPVDQLKIDKSFCDNLPFNEKNGTLVKVMLDLSRSFNLSIVAEGIETKEQLEKLEEIGYTDFQGFYFSRPLPMNGFVEYLQESYQN